MAKVRNKELVRYAHKGPGWGRATFTIYVDVKDVDGERSYKKIDDERLISINRSYSSGMQTLEQCVIQVKEIVRDLYKQDPRCRKKRDIHNNENVKLFDEFWKEVYSRKKIISVVSARNEFRRTLDLLGPLSLYSASRDELQECIDKELQGNAQRRIISRLRQFLKYIGRERVQLRMDQKNYSRVTYLTEAEFKQLLVFVTSDVERALLELCFYSGLRIGEAYGLTAGSLLPNEMLRITGQLDREGVFRATKTKKPRIAYLFPAGVAAFKRWVAATQQEKDTIDRNDASRDLMKKYCRITFPDDPSKHLTFHALRHCYAINLLSKGVSMSLVAQSLGNTLSVCEQHYVGFELTSDSIQAIQSIVGGQR